ncbi:amidase [Streptomyces sp. NPDC046887]|uniref:amidase n=1 Tax=Streptomyces sp. NPDC046887 TaxID=3155472 RepID=UPI0033D7BEC9
MRPSDLTLTAAAEAIRQRRLSPVELVDSVLARIAETEPHLNAYATVTAEQARHTARHLERELMAGHLRGPLHGIPMALKDLIDVAGLPTTASSQVRAGHLAATDSTVTARLTAAGAILVGKTHTHEFAYGLTTPQTRNAHDPGRIAGGSSGGSAVAVAANAATFALGTDTGGSIRVPAALNGVVGLKPTYDLVPRDGVVPLSWSLDHIGPLTRTAADAALVLTALTSQQPPEKSPSPSPLLPSPLRIGIPRNHYFDHITPEVETTVRQAIAHLSSLGATLTEIDLPLTRYLQATHWGLMVPEATAYHEQTLRTVPDLYGADVRVLLEAGALLSAADYLRAQRARTLIRDSWAALFDHVDLIAAPATPLTAALTSQHSTTWPDGTTETVSDAYVRLSAPANITGFPALTLPVGHDQAGLPIGMQLIARPHADSLLLHTAQAFERSSPEANPSL